MVGKIAAPDEAGKSAFLLGEWTVEPELNSLRKGALEHRVEPKVMKVLLTLVASGNHVVSKEKLIAAVWPDTFVSDDVLTRCISILRRITQDDSHAPHFIQTVPRTGYRLVAPILEIPSPDRLEQPRVPILAIDATVPDPLAVRSAPASPSWKRSFELGLKRPSTLVLWLGGFSLLAFLLIWTGSSRHTRDNAIQAFRTVQFTAHAGEQIQPAFSPDGSCLAYVAISEDGRSRRIYVKQIGQDAAFALTPGSLEEQFSPAWSPDGRSIAYLSRARSGLAIKIAQVGSPQPARQVFTPEEPSHWEQGALSWSPDGTTLIFPDHAGSQPHSSIFALDLRTGKARSLTTPPPGWEGDLNPAYSPDGKRIAFTRASETSVRDIYWLSLADGRLHALTHDRMNIDSLAWEANGRSIVFSSNRGGKYALWSIGIDAGQPRRLPVGTEDAFQPSVGPKPGQLAYAEGSAIWSIVRVNEGGGPASPEPLLASTQHDSAPSLSPDGGSFAFQSLRSGSQEIWISSIRGDALRQLTFFGGPLTGSPAWSHHGDSIVFDSRLDGHSHIFAVTASGGKPVQLTFGDANDIVPRWSHDDQAVYYRSNRGGRWQLWKIPATGGKPQPMTVGDGIEPQESADGRWLYYTRGEDSGLWRIPTAGGAETRVLTQPAAGYWGYWQLTPRGILYLDLAHGSSVLRLYNVRSRQTSLYATLNQIPPPYAGLSVDNQGEFVLATEERDAARHITLVEAQ